MCKRKGLIYMMMGAALLKTKGRNRKKLWSKKWFLRRNITSDINLLRELNASAKEDYRNYLRMDDDTFNLLLNKISPLITKKRTCMRDPISPKRRLIATLRFLATGRGYEDLKFSMRISPQALGSIIIETCEAIISVLTDYIQLPKTEDDWKCAAKGFEEKWNFPHCLGAIDGKHIQIKKPAGTCSRYFNYKGTHSIVLMAIVNADYEFLLADVGTNGRVSDGGVIRNTDFYRFLQQSKLNIPISDTLPKSTKCADYVFVGDEAFQLQKHIMKPFSQSVLNKERRIFNYRLPRARRIFENVFGIITTRFGILQNKINLPPKKVETIVLACAYLHNFLRKTKITLYKDQSIMKIYQPVKLCREVGEKITFLKPP